MKLSRAKPRIIYCTPILASYKLLVFSTVVYTLRNARTIKIKIFEGINEYFSSQTEQT